jgi:rfaE bifunctional protein kinase chain/domain
MRSLSESLLRFSRCRIAVIGDLMLDDYLWGHIERISPEAPVPILNVLRRESMLGGAGNVVENLRSLGVQVAVFGVVGLDDTGEQVCELLKSHGADTTGVIQDPGRRSTRKVRLMSLEHGQQVFRFDQESVSPVVGEIEERLVKAIRTGTPGIQAIVCSDYMKGVLTTRVLCEAFTLARELGISSIVGPKDPKSQKYRGASILMPNSRELGQMVGTPPDGDEWLVASARSLIATLGLEALLVTRGSQGMSLFEDARNGPRRVDIPTTARSVYDVTGAGDTAIATFSAAVTLRSDLEVAARLANLAAGVKVAKRGSAAVSSKELEECVKREEESTHRLSGPAECGTDVAVCRTDGGQDPRFASV